MAVEDIYYDVAAVIRELRIKKGMSQQELGEAVGYKGASTLASFENGRMRIPMHIFLALCRALDADPVQMWADIIKSYNEGQEKGFSACGSN